MVLAKFGELAREVLFYAFIDCMGHCLIGQQCGGKFQTCKNIFLMQESVFSAEVLVGILGS